MLAPGPTSTTKASSAVAAMRTRIRRPAPTRAATTNTSPVTRAQFAPDTAVRWLSALAFIAASSSSETPDSSPIARPGSRAPPSPGVSWAARANAERRGSVHPSQAGVSAITAVGCDAESRKLVDSPGSFARRTPETATTDPKEGTAPDPSATVNTVTGTLIPRTAGPAPAPSTPRAVPFQLHRSAPSNPDATRRPGLSARTCTVTSCRSWAARSRTSAVRPGAWTADTAQPSAPPARTTPTRTAPARRRARRAAETMRAAARTPPVRAAIAATPGTPIDRAHAIQRAAAGSARRRSGIRRAPDL